jgi:Family of unknown function (DUF5681)
VLSIVTPRIRYELFVLDAFLGSGTTLIAAQRIGPASIGERQMSAEVGYGKPPLATRFRKGQSGNPRGRPRGSRNLTSLIEEALAKPVAIKENGRRRKASKLQAIVKQLVDKAAQGDHRSIQLLMAFMERQQVLSKEGKPPTILELLSAIGPIDED